MLKSKMRALMVAGLAGGFAMNAIPTATTAATNDLVLGIVPQQSATRLAKIWIPLIDRLNEKTGLNIRFATAKDIPTFESCLVAGAYDLAYMNPYHYVVFSKAPGYRAFAHQKKKKLKGILVASRDSGITSLDDLRNKKIAFPSPAAFGASVLPRAEMAARGISFEPQYVKSHDSVYRAVVAGIYPAGGGVLRTFGSIPEDIRGKLNVFYETKAYTPHAFAAHPDLPLPSEHLIAEMLATIPSDDPILQSLGMKGIEPANDSTWDDVRALKLDAGQTQIRKGSEACRSD